MSTVLRAAPLLTFVALTNSPAVGAFEQAPVKDSGRYSDAEKAYVPLDATVKVSDTPRHATLAVGYGRKFAATPGGPIAITNPYLDPQKVFFARAVGLAAIADGSVIVGGEAGLDASSRVAGSGYWRIAPDGAITPLITPSVNTYGKSPATKCEAPDSRTHLTPENFAVTASGELVKTVECAVTSMALPTRRDSTRPRAWPWIQAATCGWPTMAAAPCGGSAPTARSRRPLTGPPSGTSER